MATIYCVGHSFSDTADPSPNEWMLISEAKLNDATDLIIERTRNGEDIEAEVGVIMSLTYGHQAYICPHCARLLVFFDGPDEPATIFRRE
jgi:hypothetical protein